MDIQHSFLCLLMFRTAPCSCMPDTKFLRQRLNMTLTSSIATRRAGLEGRLVQPPRGKPEPCCVMRGSTPIFPVFQELDATESMWIALIFLGPPWQTERGMKFLSTKYNMISDYCIYIYIYISIIFNKVMSERPPYCWLKVIIGRSMWPATGFSSSHKKSLVVK